ncbi:MAG: 30S ribosomal protein S2 [Opitutales bacterium]
MNITVKELLDAGVHFGHQVRRWNPKSKPYVFDHRHGISIIDLEKTYQLLEKACGFVEELTASGKNILLVGTKRQAQEVVREVATTTNMPFCANRWLGGTLTNFNTVKRSLEKYRRFLTMESDGSLAKLPKKEASAIRREMERMHRNFEGLLEMGDLPAAMLIIDSKAETNAVAEARRLKIPVVGMVDTNSDPSLLDYPIPANDDAVKSIRLIMDVLLESIQNGLARREEPKSQQKGFTPVVRQEFDEAQPEVTLSPDIMMEEESGAPVFVATPDASPADPAAVPTPAPSATSEAMDAPAENLQEGAPAEPTQPSEEAKTQ